MYGERGFLSNCPDDVVCLINGRPVTKSDILDTKRKRQARILSAKRQCYEPIERPCFVWTFYNDTFIYGGWHFYIRTSRHHWGFPNRRDDSHSMDMKLKAMSMFSCGVFPIIENFRLWKQEFARVHHYPTKKRPKNQGLALARAKVSADGYHLIDIMPLAE